MGEMCNAHASLHFCYKGRNDPGSNASGLEVREDEHAGLAGDGASRRLGFPDFRMMAATASIFSRLPTRVT